jgi:hypothetical protein
MKSFVMCLLSLRSIYFSQHLVLTSSIYILPSVQETKFHSHIQQGFSIDVGTAELEFGQFN